MTARARRRRRATPPAALATALVAAGALAGCGTGAASPSHSPAPPAGGASVSTPAAGPSTGPALATVLGRPHLLFRSTDVRQEYGVVAAAPLADPDGPRAYTGYVCDRVYAAAGTTMCLTQVRGADTTYSAQLRGPDGKVRDSWALPGSPSRARVSPSGHLVASTVFVSGHSYETRALSTVTVVRRVGGASYGNLERFTLRLDGRRVHPEDENVWGVTFAGDDRTFYATVSTGERTWLVRGDLRSRTLTSVHENAECPSLSPDGTRVAYKKRVAPEPRPWAVAVLDLATGHEAVLPATRGLDDQVEWRDDDHLLYGLPRADQPGASDIWMVAARAGAEPSLLVHDAWSPAVVR